jgi:hypothetical protein
VRRLLDEIHSISRADANSTGVLLNTEVRDNVAWCEHFGNQLLGSAKVVPGPTWCFFRPD